MDNLKPSPLVMIVFAGILGCPSPEEELPVGPCNSDGETGNDTANASGDDQDDVPPQHEISAFHPPIVRSFPGWTFDDHIGGLYRLATTKERDQHGWTSPTWLVAWPISPIAQAETGIVSVSLPIGHTAPSDPSLVQTRPIETVDLTLQKQQDLTIGNFVEHRSTADGTIHHASIPVFTYFVAHQSRTGERGELLMSSDGAFLIRAARSDSTVVAIGPHRSVVLDPPPPGGYSVATVAASRGITMPLVPYACENGDCDDPNDPLDECNDGIDNDGDGSHDTCDWNCLPHADFGAERFELARSRVEAGKVYAIMGHGSYCTPRPDTWEVEVADAALQAAEVLNSLRPDLERPIRYRTFSCWIFEDLDAYELCQFGPYIVVNGEPIYDPPVCPPEMNYPYAPTESDQLSNIDQSALTFEESIARAWSDFEYNVDILGSGGEPANGVWLLTHDITNTCLATDHPNNCKSLAGRAALASSPVQRWGSGVVTDRALDGIWPTLAHETGHTIGLVHDDFPGGLMNKIAGSVGGLGISTDPEYPNIDNNARWESGLTGSKGENPRTPGFYHTGCDGLADCAPLGKPGWSCTGLFCVEDD